MGNIEQLNTGMVLLIAKRKGNGKKNNRKNAQRTTKNRNTKAFARP